MTSNTDTKKDPADRAATGSAIAVPDAPRLRGWKAMDYTSRLTFSFALIAAMTALVAIGVLSFVWEQHFQSYTRENMEYTALSTAERIAVCYEADHGWSQNTIEAAKIAEVAFNDIGVMVVDRSGEVQYDSTANVQLKGGDYYRSSLAPLSESQIATAPIVVNNEVVGSVRVWVYGSKTLLRQTDEQFRSHSYQAMMLAATGSIILACVIGFLFARNLVRPVNRVTKTAEAIKSGDLSARTGLVGEDEVSRLGMTFDEMAESIERDRELERRLTTDVAHELRTPLMAIRSTVEAMIDGVFEPNEERLETVNSEVMRLSRLVDALLKLSRLENRSTPLKLTKIDVGELVESIVATHTALVEDSGLELHSEIVKDVYVMGDADMIRQATANLISNAVRYTPEPGTITVKVRRGEIMASISVEDTGIGLTPEEAKMVFSRFWRAEAGRNRESGGLGIGLSVVKEIVDQHGGWVQVEGRKDEGARFTIHIPLYDEKRQRALDKKAKGKKDKDAQDSQHLKIPPMPKIPPFGNHK